MGRIIAYTSCKIFVVSVVGVSFNPLLIKIIRVSYTSWNNAFFTHGAIKKMILRHTILPQEFDQKFNGGKMMANLLNEERNFTFV